MPVTCVDVSESFSPAISPSWHLSVSVPVVASSVYSVPRPPDYKTFPMLNSAEDEIYPAHKC